MSTKRVVRLSEVFLDNQLLVAVAEGELELNLNLDLDRSEFVFTGFPEPRDFTKGVDRAYLEEVGYNFANFADFFPPKVWVLGTTFWLLGRYIISDTPKIDSDGGLIPEGPYMAAFATREEAAVLFDTMAVMASLLHRLVIDFCTCGHALTEHRNWKGSEVACETEGCDCPGFTSDKSQLALPGALGLLGLEPGELERVADVAYGNYYRRTDPRFSGRDQAWQGPAHTNPLLLPLRKAVEAAAAERAAKHQTDEAG